MVEGTKNLFTGVVPGTAAYGFFPLKVFVRFRNRSILSDPMISSVLLNVISVLLLVHRRGKAQAEAAARKSIVDVNGD